MIGESPASHTPHPDPGLTIRPMTVSDASVLSAAFAAIGWNKPPELYLAYLEECAAGERVALVAETGGQLSGSGTVAGYGTVVWQSPYRHFREAGVPEIKDLNVLPAFRRRGVATALMDRLEAVIAERSGVAGIGVGLYTEYGPAQRMYVLRGYVPDGHGAFCGDEPAAAGERVRVDDSLVLFMTRRLTDDGE